MGDRTWVNLEVPVQFGQQIFALFHADLHANKKDDWKHHAMVVYTRVGPIATFEFEEVNYGDLPNLNHVIGLGIPYDISWGGGDEYGPGDSWTRFTPNGEVEIGTVYEEDKSIDVETVFNLLDKPDELRKMVTESYERVKYPGLNIGEQIEFGKIYKAKQLIKGQTL